jgi:feruloyl-CoA synthase
MTPHLVEPRYRDVRVGGCVEAVAQARPEGGWLLRSTEQLGAYPDRMGDCLAQWAEAVPERTFAARRGANGAWRRLSYRQMLERARALGQGLLDLGLSPERPLLILSDNDLEHLSLMMAAMWAGVPSVSVSPAYSLVASDFAKLRHIVARCSPGLVYAAEPSYAGAIHAAVSKTVPVLMGADRIEGRACIAFDDLLATRPGPGLDEAHAATGPDTVVKLMFTSGSTRQPKGVIVTQRMWCANQQMLRQCMAFLGDAPPVLVDWLPWNHTFGGNHNVGIALYNGGTLYIDDGRPTPQGMAETLRNLREISPTVYFNVPKGFSELVAAMRDDATLAASVFRDVKAFMCGGAGLSQATWDGLDALAEATVGERIRVMSGLGMTETAPASTFLVDTSARAGRIGRPCPGVEVKLAPVDGKYEARFRGPNVMPGYWHDPELTEAAFDEDGFYRTGDAARPIDPRRPEAGLLFDGRLAEDFKLSTGTFVNVGPLRARVIAAGDPCVMDAVVTGLNLDEIGLLVFPRLSECAALAGLPAGTAAADVLAHPVVREFFQRVTDRLWREGSGSANRPGRLHVLLAPPSIDAGEVTDKGSINQRAVLTARASLVQALHAASPAAQARDGLHILFPTLEKTT